MISYKLFLEEIIFLHINVKCLILYFGNSPFRGNAPEGAIRRIFKMAFYRLGYIGLGDCPTGFRQLVPQG